MFKFIVKLYFEIVIKSKFVCKCFIKLLENNIKIVLCCVDEKV